MLKPFWIVLAVSSALAMTAHAQSGTDQTEQDATGEGEEEAPPPPEFNGTISGTTSGAPLNAQVVCEGFGTGGPVTIQSDPSDVPDEDLNDDGTIVDISASPDGSISVNLTNANNVFSMSDDTAELGRNTLSYQIEMTFAGGVTETIELVATCE